MLRAVIIDDERRSRESLKALIEKYCDGIDVVGLADDVQNGIRTIEEMEPDAVFLDIKLKSGTGFDVIEGLETTDFQVIFTTAYDKFAVKAFKFNALDYLMKPIDVDELVGAVEKANTTRKELDSGQLEGLLQNIVRFNLKDPTITISTETSYEFLRVLEIERIDAKGSYSSIKMKSGKQYVTSKILKEYEALLGEYNFLRIHHSHLINLNEVERYIKTGGGYIIMRSGAKIPVSRRRKDAFLKALSDVE